MTRIKDKSLEEGTFSVYMHGNGNKLIPFSKGRVIDYLEALDMSQNYCSSMTWSGRRNTTVGK